jgi:hypothetical protein
MVEKVDDFVLVNACQRCRQIVLPRLHVKRPVFYWVESLNELLPVKVFETFSVHRLGEEQHVNCWMLCSRRMFWPMWHVGGKINRNVIWFDCGWW